MCDYNSRYYEYSRDYQNEYKNNNERYWPNQYEQNQYYSQNDLWQQNNWCPQRHCCEQDHCCEHRHCNEQRFSVTQCSMNAQNTTGQAITVAVAGTDIPLPNNQNLDGFNVNAANTIFTVPATGTYLVTYQVNTTTASLLSTRVLRNGNTIPGSIFIPATPVSSFTATTIVQLYAGDQLELQFFGVATTITLQGGVGASLTVVRLA